MYRVKSNAVWHSLPGVVAAYQPIAAPDPFASRQNVAHSGARFGVYTAMPGVLPTWSGAVGWVFNGTTQFLSIGDVLLVNSQGTLIVRFASSGSTAACLVGVSDGVKGGVATLFSPGLVTSRVRYAYGNQAHEIEPNLTSGVVGVSLSGGYRNGILNTAVFSPSWSGIVQFPLFAGALNLAGTAQSFLTGSIQCILLARRTLSPAEMWLASRQMAYCEQNPDWNAWARRRRYYYAPSEISALVAMRRRQSDANRIGSRGAIE